MVGMLPIIELINIELNPPIGSQPNWEFNYRIIVSYGIEG
jgi:hypothetical protein